LVKFRGYPFEEYGSVEGRIAAISSMPVSDSTYLIKVVLPEGLITNYKKKLSYHEGMGGNGEIITAHKRLIEKFIYNLIKTIGR